MTDLSMEVKRSEYLFMAAVKAQKKVTAEEIARIIRKAYDLKDVNSQEVKVKDISENELISVGDRFGILQMEYCRRGFSTEIL